MDIKYCDIQLPHVRLIDILKQILKAMESLE